MTLNNEYLVYFSVYQDDESLVKRTVIRLQDIGYDEIIVRFDGEYNLPLITWLFDKGVYVHSTARLKRKGKGGLVTHTYLGLFLGHKNKRKWLIKIDPDTLPLKALVRNPRTNVACNVHPERPHIYGGCIVMHRDLTRRIYETNALLKEEYTTGEYLYRHDEYGYLPCQDMIIYDVLKNMGEKIDPYDDVVHARNERDRIYNPGKEFVNRFCFYHPDKDAKHQ